MMTPIFTSGKLKAIMPTVNECCDEYIKYLGKIDRNDIDMKASMALSTCEILGRIGCGVKPDIFKDPDNNYFYSQVRSYIDFYRFELTNQF